MAAAQQDAGERGLQAGQDDLGLRVAEAGVELDDPDAARGDREARVEQPGEGGAAAAQLVDGRLQDASAMTSSTSFGSAHGQRGVRAHAAGVRALVAVERALEVLGGLERDDGLAVGDGEEGDLGAVEELLDDHAVAGAARARGPRRGRR